jgi:hypothetical protein
MENKNTPKGDYISKRLVYSNMNREIRTMSSLKDIDSFDYDANCSGCTINDYDKFRRHRRTDMMLLIGVLLMYFLVGMLVGAVAMIQYFTQI